MKKLAVAAAAILFVVAMVSVAFSYGGARGHGRGPCYGGDMTAAMSEINLTADQTAKIKALQEAHARDIKPLQDRQFSKRGDLRLLWMQEKPDQEKIRATQKEVRGLRDQIEDKRTAFRQEVLKVLTPEQQSKLKSRFPGWGYCSGGDGPGMGMGGRGTGMGAGMHGDRW